MVDESVRYAGFWVRFCAHMIDLVICFIAFFIFSKSYELFFHSFLSEWGFVFFMYVFYSFYFIFMESSVFSATLGKQMMGLSVLTEEGMPVSFFRAALRYSCEILSVLFLFSGYFMIVFSERKQSLHDHLASTVVVYSRRNHLNSL